MVVEQTVPLEALQGERLEELLQRVVDQQLTVTIRLPDGREVVIEPKRFLKPLPVLEGYVPTGWKDAIYTRG